MMIEVKNSYYLDEAQTIICCDVKHPILGWIPFTASPDDSESFGKLVYKEVLLGEHGLIASYSPPPLPSKEFLADKARSERDRFLSESDWTQLPDAQATLSAEQQLSWATYRKALRDISEQSCFPETIDWPKKP